MNLKLIADVNSPKLSECANQIQYWEAANANSAASGAK
jgi:hypothetical protein